MTVTVDIADASARENSLKAVFDYFTYVDETFSTYKEGSEISRINRGELAILESSQDMQEVFRLSEETKIATKGYFDIQTPSGLFDPSGLVKGWAIRNAARLLDDEGYMNFFVDVGGDVELRGLNHRGEPWSLGIKNPFDESELVKVVFLSNAGIATSGTYIRGNHIYNPLQKGTLEEVVSLTVIGPDVYEADRFATSAFAMGIQGIYFIEALHGFEGYMIDASGQGTGTTGFSAYTKEQ